MSALNRKQWNDTDIVELVDDLALDGEHDVLGALDSEDLSHVLNDNSDPIRALGSPSEFGLRVLGRLAETVGQALDGYLLAPSGRAGRLALARAYCSFREWLASAASWNAQERAAFAVWLARNHHHGRSNSNSAP